MPTIKLEPIVKRDIDETFQVEMPHSAKSQMRRNRHGTYDIDGSFHRRTQLGDCQESRASAAKPANRI